MDIQMKFRKIYAIPLIVLTLATIYIMLFNTTQYLEVVFIFYTSTILIRAKLLQFFEKNRFILFIVAELLLLTFTATTSFAILTLEEDKTPVLVIANVFVLLMEMGYSLKEYPYKFKAKSFH